MTRISLDILISIIQSFLPFPYLFISRRLFLRIPPMTHIRVIVIRKKSFNYYTTYIIFPSFPVFISFFSSYIKNDDGNVGGILMWYSKGATFTILVEFL